MQVETTPSNPNTTVEQKPKSNVKQKFSYGLIVVLVVISFILGWFVGYLMGVQKSSAVKPIDSANQSSVKESKIYINDYYHISFEIPDIWKVNEYTKDDGHPAFKLSSTDDQISIESPLPDFRQEGTKSSNHIKQELDKTTVKLGEYSRPRSRYINDFDETQDYISLNIPFQKGVNFSFRVTGDYETNNQILLSVLKTFKFTQQEPSLDTLISYQLPTGWTSEKRNPSNETDDDSLSFVSADYKPNEGMGINTGAMLRISRQLKDPRKTMIEIIEQNLPVPLEKESSQAKPVKIGAVDSLNLFTCWEGCYDDYYIEQDDYYWLITFSCADSCSSKAKMNVSKYAKDKDIFLNSFSFK